MEQTHWGLTVCDFRVAWSGLSNHEVIWPYLPKILLVFAFCGLGGCKCNREARSEEENCDIYSLLWGEFGWLVCGMRNPSTGKTEHLCRDWDTNFRRWLVLKLVGSGTKIWIFFKPWGKGREKDNKRWTCALLHMPGCSTSCLGQERLSRSSLWLGK